MQRLLLHGCKRGLVFQESAATTAAAVEVEVVVLVEVEMELPIEPPPLQLYRDQYFD